MFTINPNFRNNYFIFNDEKFINFSNVNVDNYTNHMEKKHAPIIVYVYSTNIKNEK